jgi:nucleoside-diphosphate-sugar epimerase
VRLVVTGGSGFLGGFVLREAVRRGYEVAALARSPAAAATVRALGARPVPGDLAAPGPAAAATLARAFGAGDLLVNLASLGFGDAPAIVTAAERAQVRVAVFVSTLTWTILRPTMIYGAPGDRNLSRLLPLLRRAPVLPVPGGRHLQQPVHVADVAHAVLAAAELIGAELIGAELIGAEPIGTELLAPGPGDADAKPGGVTYDLAGPAPMTFDELLRTAGRAVGSRTRFVPVPLPPVLAAARGYELVSRQPRIRAEQVARLAEDKSFAIEAAARDLGFAPRSFAAGIASEARALGLAA